MDPSRILLISLSNIGDAILTTPALDALARRWPSAAITVLAGPRAVPLFERDPRVAQVWSFEKTASLAAWWRLFLASRRERFDLVVDLRQSLLPWLVGARRRSPFVRRVPAGVHRAQTHLDVVRRLGVPVEGVGPRVVVGPEDERAVDGWLAALPSGAPVVAIAPGARSHLKRWTVPGFAAVADAVAREPGAQVLLVGNAEDRPIAEQVAAAMQYAPVNLTGRTTLRQLAALFRRVSLVLTNDSACLHLACAVGTPVVALFGPTDPIKYGPTGPRDAVVRLDLVCSPCERALCPYGHECLQWLPARAVLAAVRNVLGKGV